MTFDELASAATGWVVEKSVELHGQPAEVGVDDDLLASGTLDSLAFVALVTFIEDTTGAELDLLELDPDDFASIRGLCAAALEEPA